MNSQFHSSSVLDKDRGAHFEQLDSDISGESVAETVSDTDFAASESGAPLSLGQCAAKACSRIAPLWPLKNFVAVNPFVGLTGRSFLECGQIMRRVAHGDIVMDAAFYADAARSGRISDADLEAALTAAKTRNQGALVRAWLETQTPRTLHETLRALLESDLKPSSARGLNVADWLDAQNGSRFGALVVEEIAKWCAAFYDNGQSSWTMPWRDSLFNAWKAAAAHDLNPELAGIARFRAFAAQLPDAPLEAIQAVLARLGVPLELTEEFLHRELMSIAGWSAAVQYRVRQNAMDSLEDDTSLLQLLAIRLAYDGALFAGFVNEKCEREWLQNLEDWREALLGATHDPDLLALWVFQRALENGYGRELLEKLGDSPPEVGPTEEKKKSHDRPLAQGVFCIDVRSEVLRRHLENAGPKIETLGFAGFFGFAIEAIELGEGCGSAQCPVLLSPKFRVREAILGASGAQQERVVAQKRLTKRLARSWSEFKSSAVSSFSFVESAGLWSGISLVKHTFGLQGEPEKSVSDYDVESAMTLEDQIANAFGALRGMSLLSGFARLVLLCGHGSQTTNNPYGSGLDCGACGGCTGQANATVAATVFNNPKVRMGLREKGIEIPDDTVFLAGLHNTTTDEVEIFGIENVPDSHREALAQLQNALKVAGQRTRAERAFSLNLRDEDASKLDTKIAARAKDWSQVRPEWGLAGNAAFIAAPRERTQNLKLGGRTFLHNYDWRLDGDNAILSLIMNAPMVVASWINLQYFGSTVNNRAFGSGTKVIHNVVGKWGVVQGNGGDLQTGLPLQSLHDGQNWVHEPLRLSVILEAPRERIAEVIENSPGVRDLVNNEWLHLFALEENGAKKWRYDGAGGWNLMVI